MTGLIRIVGGGTHIADGQRGHILCDKKRKNRAVGHPSEAKKLTCRNCVKVQAVYAGKAIPRKTTGSRRRRATA